MASLLTPRRDCQTCTPGDGIGNGEIVSITTSLTREVFLRCAPVVDATPQQQATAFYDSLPRVLEQAGIQYTDILLERVFFRDLFSDHDVLDQVRQDAYRTAGIEGAESPAASYINQPPCNANQAFEWQIQAVCPNASGSVQVHSFASTKCGADTKLIEIGDRRHLYITGINGIDSRGVLSRDFRQQSDTMFAKSVQLLSAHNTPFSKVLRTWCYLDDIDRDYDQFNLSRNAFFAEHQITRLPASTGIRAGLHPPGAGCAFDLYALLDPEGVAIEVMHTPTLNEADEYGSAFSRGMKVGLPEKTVLYISGTASVDEQGATVHLNDVPKQIERMLVNVRELLKPHNSDFADTVQTITYLKSADYLPIFQQIWNDWGLGGLPNTFVEAGVCRPDLLCEMESIVIVPPAEELDV